MSPNVNIAVSEGTNENAVCTYCRDALGDSSIWDCKNCHTKLHQECFDELNSCTTLGCHKKPEIDTINTITVELPDLEPLTPGERFELVLKLILITPVLLGIVLLTLYAIYQFFFRLYQAVFRRGNFETLLFSAMIIPMFGLVCQVVFSMFWTTVKRLWS